jgi:hypothetical protein
MTSSSKPPADRQLNLPPTFVTNSSEAPAPRTICSSEPEVLGSLLFDEALRAVRDLHGNPAPITSKEAADLVGVSVSLVDRWRSPNYREAPSLTQLLRLPPSFHLELHRAMNRRFGFGRQLLRRLLDAVGDLALVAER